MRSTLSLRCALSRRVASSHASGPLVLPRRAPVASFAVTRSAASEALRSRGAGWAQPLAARSFATDQAAGSKEKAGDEAKAQDTAAKAGEEAKAGEKAGEEATAEKQETGSASVAGAADAAPEPAAKEPEKSPEEVLQKQLEDLQEKLKKEKHSLLLALADFENNKKRFLRERESRRRTASVNFATRLIETYDKFDELVHAEDDVKSMSEACQGLQEGIALTRNLFRSTLERFDVNAIEADIGKPLVKDMHESVGSVKGSDLPADSVAELVKAGWVLEAGSGKPAAVLRKAHVKVAAAA